MGRAGGSQPVQEYEMLDDLFAEDYVAPADQPLPKTGVMKLCWAMLDLAWQDVQRQAWRDRRDKLDAMQWFLSDVDHQLSFRNICAILRLDAERILLRLHERRFLDLDAFTRRVKTWTEEKWNRKSA